MKLSLAKTQSVFTFQHEDNGGYGHYVRPGSDVALPRTLILDPASYEAMGKPERLLVTITPD